MNDEKLHHGLMFLPFSCRNLCTHKYRKHPLGISTYHQKMNNFYNLMHSSLIMQYHTDTPYRQDPNLGEGKGGLLGPKKDKYEVCSLLDKAHPLIRHIPIFGSRQLKTANSARLLDIKTEVRAQCGTILIQTLCSYL